MGQRLNISLESDGEVVANAYYHWSAYTRSAAYLIQSICEVWDELKEESRSETEFACRLLHDTGAGFGPEEIGRIRYQRDSRVNAFPLWPSTNRNNGLLSITQEGIETTEQWEEGRVTIYLDTGQINFGVADWIPADDYQREWGDLGDLDDLPRLAHDPAEMLTVDNFSDFYDFLENNRNYCYFIEDSSEVFMLIE